MTSFEIGIKNPSENLMANQIQFHKIFPYLSTAIQNTVSQNFLISFYKQLHTTLIMLTYITMLKHVVFKTLEKP